MPVVFFVDPKIREDEDTKAHRRDHAELYILPGGNSELRRLEPLTANRGKQTHGRDQEPRLSSPRSRSLADHRRLLRRFALFGGLVMWMHDNPYGKFVFALGVLGVLVTMSSWWSNTIREAHTGYHTPVVQLHLRYGMILFIASEVMFFLAWFWAFFRRLLIPFGGRGGRRRMAAQGHRSARPVRLPAAQHDDPALLGHDRHLGAPCADPRRPRGPQDRPAADDPARHAVHQHPGL